MRLSEIHTFPHKWWGSVAKRIAAQAEDYQEGYKRKPIYQRRKANGWKDQGPHRSRAERDGKSKSNGTYGDNRLE